MEWHAHSGGGNVVVTDQECLWLGRQAMDASPKFKLLERDLLPPEPIVAVAVDATHLVAATGQIDYVDEDEGRSRGDVNLAVIDLPSKSIVASKTVPLFGDRIGICSGHVLAWYWWAQADILTIDSPMRMDGGTSSFSTVDFDDFVHCDLFEVYGDTMAGSVGFEGVVHLAGLGSDVRDVQLFQRYSVDKHSPYLGFDLDGRLVWSYKSKSWVLGDGDRWEELNGTLTQAEKAAEYSGADGRPVALTESEIRSSSVHD